MKEEIKTKISTKQPQAQEISKEMLLKLKDKYIFHGSHSLFDICKPHQAKCGSKSKENEQFAIYGASDIYFAILFAFEKLPKTKYSWQASVDDNGQSFGLLKDGTYIDEQDFGYIYCFDKTNFEPTTKGGVQFVCKKEQKPMAIYKVYYKDFKELFEVEAINKAL